MKECTFCSMEAARIIYQSDHVLVIRDGFPISKGHTLIIPKRHVQSFFETTNEEERELFNVLRLEKSKLDHEFHPDGYNVGINDGTAAGQTVMHLHIHLIPRYVNDVQDPRGGVRWIIPSKAAYW